MKVSGATIIRNGIRLGFPFLESVKSVLPLCDEFIIAVGDSEDDTRKHIENINDDKIKIIDTAWDMQSRRGGEVLSQQTNLAFENCAGDWIFYIQSDEAVHEKDFGVIRSALAATESRRDIEGIAFRYYHFYGSYFTVQSGRNWYQKEVRIIRNNCGIRSHGDAQGFRRDGRKIRAVTIDANIYHYGWARPPEAMVQKIKSFHKLWHDDEWIKKNCSSTEIESYFPDLGNLVPFEGTHPAVMSGRVNRDSEPFIKRCRENYLANRSLRQKFVDIRRRLPIGEHRNFKELV